MKVLKDGAVGKPENWTAEVTCKKVDEHDSKGCGAVLSVTFEDLVLMYYKGSHFDHYYPAIHCPQCGKHTRVHRVPKPLWEKFDTDAAKKKALFDGFSDRH